MSIEQGPLITTLSWPKMHCWWITYTQTIRVCYNQHQWLNCMISNADFDFRVAVCLFSRFECLCKRFTRSLFATEAKVNLELAYSYISSFWKETSFVSNSFCCNFWRVYRWPPGPGTHRFYRWLHCLVSHVVFLRTLKCSCIVARYLM